MGATALYQLDTERDKDAQAIFERSQKIQEVQLTALTGTNIVNSSLCVLHALQCKLHLNSFTGVNRRKKKVSKLFEDSLFQL